MHINKMVFFLVALWAYFSTCILGVPSALFFKGSFLVVPTIRHSSTSPPGGKSSANEGKGGGGGRGGGHGDGDGGGEGSSGGKPVHGGGHINNGKALDVSKAMIALGVVIAATL